MADNVTLNPGTGGSVIATDDVGGVQYQKVKITLGGDGVSESEVSSSNPIPTNAKKSTTATATQVADIASSTTLLASNANRLGATVFNDSSALLYVLLGSGVASATNYTAKLYSNGYYECPSLYTGQINGIWATDPGDGGAKVTELT